MPIDRASWRNLWLYEAATGNLLGGTYQNGSLTESNFISAIDIILLVANDEWTVVNRSSGRTVQHTASAIQPGIYDVHSRNPVHTTDEEWVARVFSHSVSGRDNRFRDAVRRRDGGCVISGVYNIRSQWDIWSGFEAAHVFPLEHESLWLSSGCERWVMNMNGWQGNGNIGSHGINSVHNGLLMRSDLHKDFDNYLFSINPDDGYKITYFGPDPFGVDGKMLDSVCRIPTNPHRVCDELLRWHFRQSVLANMKGGGAPVFEHDFPPGTDMLGELRAQPHGRQQLELELFSRLKDVSNNEGMQTFSVAAQDKTC